MKSISDISEEKIKTYISHSIIISRKSCRLLDDNKENCRTRYATDDNIILLMRFAYLTTKARTQVHTLYN